MPFITSFMAFEKRLKTMNKGRPLPADILEFFNENMNRGIGIMSLEDMSEITTSLSGALQLDKPVTEQVSNHYTYIQFGLVLFLEEKTLLLCHEQTTLDIEKLNEIYRIKLRAFLPQLFGEDEVETEVRSEVSQETMVPQTREFANLSIGK
jgi:hypothetical protein